MKMHRDQMHKRGKQIGELEKRLEQKEMALENSVEEVAELKKKSQLHLSARESRGEKREMSIETAQMAIELLPTEHGIHWKQTPKAKTLEKMCQTRVTRMGFKARMEKEKKQHETIEKMKEEHEALDMEQRV